ncbi:hypothetical protein Y032_0012g1778 [Ancylostoma ceylanicum]|uniref:Integral membrane protein 2 n=1 Tax=Ancylostoma ceylanicum TaxID=53326 RepID=A0A016VDX8_9BILA|nr:hypothetical protein Y032_0012g1778 [Ancylostoma ceylanicum]
MTVFTKTNEDSKEVPKVVVSEPSNTPTAPPAKERDISNAGWVPMEGGNFDRPVKERSSSFGPLSIIRLSPSPLARTPSPTLPENGNSGKKTRRKFCIMLFVLVMLGMVLYLGTVFFHYHAKLVRFAYHEGVDHGKMAAKYQSFDMQKAPVKAEMKAERNLTAIIDEICKRCFAKQLYDNAVSSPINFMNILTGSPSSLFPPQRTMRGRVRICGPLRRAEIEALGSLIITDTTCSNRN